MKLKEILYKRYDSKWIDGFFNFTKNSFQIIIINALLSFAVKLFLIFNFLNSIFSLNFIPQTLYFGDYIESFYYLTAFTLFLVPIVDVPLFALVYVHNSGKKKSIKNGLLALIAGISGAIVVILLTFTLMYILVQLLKSGYFKMSSPLTS